MGLLEKIKLLFKARKPATDIINEVGQIKSGWKTIPFWVTLLGTLISLVAALEGFIPASTALIATTALTAIYNILRGATKTDITGTKPVVQSTEFWLGVLGQLSNAAVTLKTGGIAPHWLVTAETFISAAMAAGQNLAGQQPSTPLEQATAAQAAPKALPPAA